MLQTQIQTETDLQTLVLLGMADVSQRDLRLEVDVILVVGVRGGPPPGGAPPAPQSPPPPAGRRRRGPPRARGRGGNVPEMVLGNLDVADPHPPAGLLIVFRPRGLRPTAAAADPVLAPGAAERRHVGVAVAAPGRVHPAGALRPHVRPQPRRAVPVEQICQAFRLQTLWPS